MDMASRQVRRVTNHAAIDTEPFWGKDGQTLYFTSDRSGKPQIYRMNINSGAAERVTFIGNYNANPKLSADEKTLVMIHRQDGYAVFKVAAQDLQRGSLRILSNSSLDESPTVAPNGTMVIYATHQQGRGVLMLASINGRVRLHYLAFKAKSESLHGPLPKLMMGYLLTKLNVSFLELVNGNA